MAIKFPDIFVCSLHGKGTSQENCPDCTPEEYDQHAKKLLLAGFLSMVLYRAVRQDRELEADDASEQERFEAHQNLAAESAVNLLDTFFQK
jgi:hypothetical protein